MHPRVSIIILNWNGWKDTIECLESVYRIDYPNYDVILVDNASQDDSIQKIREYAEGKIKVNSKFFEYNSHNKPIRVFEISEEEAKKGKFNRPLYEKFDVDRRLILIKNRNNYGFADGNNVGIKFALSVLNPNYILLLNNDTVVSPNFLTELLKISEKNEKIGILGPTVYFYDYYGKSNIVSFAGATLIPWSGREKRYYCCQEDSVLPNMIQEVEKIEGSCMLIKSEVFLDVGFLDSSFFCYWEETDFNIRALKRGHRLIYVPKSKIWHKISASTGGYLSNFYVYHFYRNRTWFLRKNYPRKILTYNTIYVLLCEVWYKLAQLVFKHKKPKTYLKYLKALKDGFLKA